MSGPSAPGLTLHDLHHAYRARPVLGGLALQVGAGELVGLLGPNGSGKSTALALIGGLAVVQRGAITWRDHAGLTHAAGTPGLRARLGMVFQHPSLDRQLTARQNLALAAELQGLGRRTAAARVDALLAWADLADRAKDAVRTFSGGMQRRLEFARAIVHEPELLLLDEPTTGLDAPSFARTWALVDDLRARRQLTVVLATHRPDEAARCDRLVVLDAGRAVRIDTPKALIAELAPDLVVIEASDPAALVATLAERLGVAARLDEAAHVVIECERGHELIARVIAALPAGRIDAISLRRPTLADVFAKLTGAALDASRDASRDAAAARAEAA